MIKYSFIAIAFLASMTTSWDSRTGEGLDGATKSSTEANDGRPEKVDTADSLDEKGSMRQLQSNHHHSANITTIRTTKTSTDMSNIQTTAFQKRIFSKT